MNPIEDLRVSFENNKWIAICKCSKPVFFTAKCNALKMLERGSCRYCHRSYEAINNREVGIYKRHDGRWCSTCSGCGVEQAYTRKDHAKQSHLQDWQCKKCVSESKAFHANQSVGNSQRMFNRIKNTAKDRQIYFDLTVESMMSKFSGKCALTGWDISIAFRSETASLDRIDSNKGYVIDNIQWVHKMVNMTKNKYSQDEFVKMCKAIANNIP